jgi:glycosyltransferase involved in cell wall biosynthesis
VSLYEGFGLGVLEAMACGAPVVVSSTSSLPEVVGDAGLLVDPTNEQEIASAMQRLLDDSSLREELRRRSMARAALFSWERTTQQTLDVYRRMLG